jgi:DNA polymerase elongation subunit (family B)
VELPNLYCLDFSVLLNTDLIPSELSEIRGRGLNDYCKVFGLLQKNNEYSHAEYRRRFQRCENMNDYIEYCVNDCELLRQIQLSRKLINKKLMFVEEDGICLDFALYATTAKCIQYVLAREIINAGLPMDYSKKSSDMKRPGAFTYNDRRIIGGVIENLSDADFTSEYPSVIIQNNLSWENISQCETADDADYTITDLNGDAVAHIKIEKSKPGILCEFLREKFNKRLEYKSLMKTDPENKQYWDQKQYHQKIFINSTFGVVYSTYSYASICEPLIGAACTSISRDWTKRAKIIYEELGYPVIQCDTDGLIACAESNVCGNVSTRLQ